MPNEQRAAGAMMSCASIALNSTGADAAFDIRGVR